MKKPNNISKNFKAMSRKAKELGFKNVMEALDAGYDSQLENTYNNSKHKRDNRRREYSEY